MKRRLPANSSLTVALFMVLGMLGVVSFFNRSRVDAGQASASPVKKIELPPDNPMSKLKPGPGVERVRADCAICHSTDYIVRQPGGDAAHWEPEVRKMNKFYGAHTPEEDIPIIVRYLAAAYGTPPTAQARSAPVSTHLKAPAKHGPKLPATPKQ